MSAENPSRPSPALRTEAMEALLEAPVLDAGAGELEGSFYGCAAHLLVC